MSVMRPQRKRPRKRSSKVGMASGMRSEEMTICLFAPWSELNVWKNSSCSEDNVPTSGMVMGAVTLYQYLIHKQRLHVDSPKVKSDGEMFSRAGLDGFIMGVIVYLSTDNC